MVFDGGIDEATFQTRACERERSQFPFENFEASLLRAPHSSHVRPGRGVNPAQLGQQIFDISSDIGGARAGEDFPNHRKTIADRGPFGKLLPATT